MERDGLVLASASPSRRRMLEATGLSFRVRPADVDEPAIRSMLLSEAETTSSDVSEMLARVKAETVSSDVGADAIVIGSDQVLEFEGQIIGKSATIEELRALLLRMRRKTHRLISSVAVARDGATVWQHTDTAIMTMRAFEPAWLGRYLACAGDEVLTSVGGYHLEGVGAHLFEAVDGDYFTVLGMPLLPLLRYLDESQGVSL